MYILTYLSPLLCWGAQAIDELPPSNSIWCQFYCRVPVVSLLFQYGLCVPTPGVSWLSSTSFALWACLVMLLGGFLSVWPIHAHFLFLICMFMESWFALCQRSSFLTLSNHRMFMIFLRQQLMNLWIFDNMAFVVLHVSAPYKSTDFTFELKIFSVS